MNDARPFNLLAEWYRSLGVGTDMTECVLSSVVCSLSFYKRLKTKNPPRLTVCRSS